MLHEYFACMFVCGSEGAAVSPHGDAGSWIQLSARTSALSFRVISPAFNTVFSFLCGVYSQRFVTVVIWCLLCFETESYSVPQAGLKITAILLSQSLTPCAQISTWGRGKPWKWQHFYERILFNRTKDSLTITFCSSLSVAWWHFSILQCLKKSRRYPKRVSTPYPTYVSTATSMGVSSKTSLNGLL